MTPEQVLYFSTNCFGTADAIGFRDDFLRVHDLKTGVTPCKFTQLEIYAALFCLEYGFRPMSVGMELRIYQNDEVAILEPDPLDIMNLMEKIKYFDKRVDELREEAYG